MNAEVIRIDLRVGIRGSEVPDESNVLPLPDDLLVLPKLEAGGWGFPTTVIVRTALL